MNKKHLYILCGLLVLIGTALTLYRALFLEFPFTPRETTATWRVEARVSFEAQGAPTKATLMVPRSEPGLTLLDESFVSPTYGLTTASPNENRIGVFSKREARGLQTLYYRAVIHRTLTLEKPAKEPEPVLQRSRYKDAELVAARQIVSSLEEQSADNETFVRLLFARLKDPQAGGPARLLIGSVSQSKGPVGARRVDVAVRVLGEARIPARAVHGLAL